TALFIRSKKGKNEQKKQKKKFFCISCLFLPFLLPIKGGKLCVWQSRKRHCRGSFFLEFIV
ncbi:MAG: hypothetical protein J2P31_02165, partial [Blastocatellia bacterium]|nr:hypothetical protein [Blastocatellia bacterium]